MIKLAIKLTLYGLIALLMPLLVHAEEIETKEEIKIEEKEIDIEIIRTRNKTIQNFNFNYENTSTIEDDITNIVVESFIKENPGKEFILTQGSIDSNYNRIYVLWDNKLNINSNNLTDINIWLFYINSTNSINSITKYEKSDTNQYNATIFPRVKYISNINYRNMVTPKIFTRITNNKYIIYFGIIGVGLLFAIFIIGGRK